MEAFDLDNNPGYRHIKYVNHIKKYPLVCQGLMKNYYQCVERFKGSRADKESLSTHEKTCEEKFNYKECLTENFTKIRDPKVRINNVREITEWE